MSKTAENTASCALCRRHLLVGEPARLYQDPGVQALPEGLPALLRPRRAARLAGRRHADRRRAREPAQGPPAARAREPDRPPARPAAVASSSTSTRCARAGQGRAAGRRAAHRQARDEGADRRAAQARARAAPAGRGQEAQRRGGRAGRRRPAGPRSTATTRRPPSSTSAPRRSASWRAGSPCSSRSSTASAGATPTWPRRGRREGDPRTVRRIALDAFNRSEHVERVVAISRSLGDPIVHVGDRRLRPAPAGADHRRLGHLLVRVPGPARPPRADRHGGGGAARRRPARAAPAPPAPERRAALRPDRARPCRRTASGQLRPSAAGSEPHGGAPVGCANALTSSSPNRKPPTWAK